MASWAPGSPRLGESRHMTLLKWPGALLALWLLAWALTGLMPGPPPPAPLFAARLDPELRERVRIAPITEALSFARFRRDGSLHTLRIERFDEDLVHGIVLGTDDP